MNPIQREAAELPPAETPPAELQQSARHGIARDEKLKRIVKQHPQRDIAKVESGEPAEMPPKE